MTIGQLMDEILNEGPLTPENLIEKMKEKGVVEVFTSSVLTGRLVKGEVINKNGLLYKKEKHN